VYPPCRPLRRKSLRIATLEPLPARNRPFGRCPVVEYHRRFSKQFQTEPRMRALLPRSVCDLSRTGVYVRSWADVRPPAGRNGAAWFSAPDRTRSKIRAPHNRSQRNAGRQKKKKGFVVTSKTDEPFRSSQRAQRPRIFRSRYPSGFNCQSSENRGNIRSEMLARPTPSDPDQCFATSAVCSKWAFEPTAARSGHFVFAWPVRPCPRTKGVVDAPGWVRGRVP